jgi:very-short-patch-repair endonuclease
MTKLYNRLEQKGIYVLRFTNLEIRENIEGVIEKLLTALPAL